MDRYDYREALKQDIKDYINDNELDITTDYDSVYDELWLADSVTGNGSGSYTFSAWQAEENLCHNMELLREAAQEFDVNPRDLLERGAEYMDVTIRCYLLGQALSEVLEEMCNENEQK